MKDLIAKLQLDANCALGAIWMHIDAQAARIAELEAQIAAKPADTDKLREALKMAIIQNSCDMLMTGEEMRQCEAALASTALQAPVREVPEGAASSAITLPDSWLKVSEHGNPPDGLYMAIYKGDGKSLPVTLAGYGEYEFDSEDDEGEIAGIGWVEYSEDRSGDCFTIIRDVIAYIPVNLNMESLKAVRASLPAAPVQEPKP